MDKQNLTQKQILKTEISRAISDWKNTKQPIEILRTVISDVINNNFNFCEKCNQIIPNNEEYFSCILENSPHPIKHKVCFKCFETYILNTAG